MKVKAEVRGKAGAQLSKSRKCLEMGKDLTRLQVGLNLLGIAMFKGDKKETKERAKTASNELRRFGDRYPLTKPRLAAAEKDLGRMAAGRKVKSLVAVRMTLTPLFVEAERSCS